MKRHKLADDMIILQAESREDFTAVGNLALTGELDGASMGDRMHQAERDGTFDQIVERARRLPTHAETHKLAKAAESELYDYCFDFDGVFARKTVPFDPERVGEPIPLGLALWRALVERGNRCIIATARTDLAPVNAFLAEHGLPDAIHGKPIARCYIDDRGMNFSENRNLDQLLAEAEGIAAKFVFVLDGAHRLAALRKLCENCADPLDAEGWCTTGCGTHLAKDWSYASLTLDVPEEIATAIRQFAAALPQELVVKLPKRVHVTVLWGLDPDTDTARLREFLATQEPIEVEIGPTSIFEDTGDGEVLKCDLLSASLNRLNELLRETFENTQTHNQFRPHLTIAFMEPGTAAVYAGDERLKGLMFTAYQAVFSDTDESREVMPFADAEKLTKQWYTDSLEKGGYSGTYPRDEKGRWLPGEGEPPKSGDYNPHGLPRLGTTSDPWRGAAGSDASKFGEGKSRIVAFHGNVLEVSMDQTTQRAQLAEFRAGQLAALPANVRERLEIGMKAADESARLSAQLRDTSDPGQRAQLKAQIEDQAAIVTANDTEHIYQNDPERLAYQNSVQRLYLSGHDAQDNPRIIQIAGGTASGKTGVTADAAKAEMADHVYLNTDDIRTMAPEFPALVGSPYMGLIHEEAGYIRDSIITGAAARSFNMVLDAPGSHGIAKILDNLEQQKAYQVGVYYVHKPIEEAIPAALGRSFHTSNAADLREVPEQVTRGSHDKARTAMAELTRSSVPGSYREFKLFDKAGATRGSPQYKTGVLAYWRDATGTVRVFDLSRLEGVMQNGIFKIPKSTFPQ
jgi:2'-5' RNA ligase